MKSKPVARNPKERPNGPSEILGGALDFGKRGWRVFPCFEATAKGECGCGDSSCENVGKHPRIARWPGLATTDSKTIRRWWTKWPTANIGIATGRGSDL